MEILIKFTALETRIKEPSTEGGSLVSVTPFKLASSTRSLSKTVVSLGAMKG
jgi:hypothetical protein